MLRGSSFRAARGALSSQFSVGKDLATSIDAPGWPGPLPCKELARAPRLLGAWLPWTPIVSSPPELGTHLHYGAGRYPAKVGGGGMGSRPLTLMYGTGETEKQG